MDSTAFPTVMIYNEHTIRPCIKMCPNVYTVKSSGFVQWRYFFSLAIYLCAGVKEMVVCKVLSQGIPSLNKTNLNENCLVKKKA